MWCGDLLKNMAGKLLGQHPLADTDELNTALTSLHRKVLRRTRGGAPAPRFVEIGHPNSQVDTTWSFHDLDLLQLPFSSRFPGCNPWKPHLLFSEVREHTDRPVFRTRWCCHLARSRIWKWQPSLSCFYPAEIMPIQSEDILLETVSNYHKRL